jgi:hypothetical protein
MPVRSKKQNAFLWSQKPDVAKKLAADTTPAQFKALPVRVPKPRMGAKRALPARGGTR